MAHGLPATPTRFVALLLAAACVGTAPARALDIIRHTGAHIGTPHAGGRGIATLHQENALHENALHGGTHHLGFGHGKPIVP